MRQFALINSVGESYELNDLSNFFHDPNGLGFTRKADYLKIGDHYQILTDGYDQAVLTGYICFSDEKNSPAYAKYAKFAQFIQNIPLILVYRSDKNHQIEVVPEMITKTEISKPLGLDVAVTFKALTLWYDEVEKSGTTSVQILSDSKLEGPCRIDQSFLSRTLHNIVFAHPARQIYNLGVVSVAAEGFKRIREAAH